MCGTVKEAANNCKKDSDFQEFDVLPAGPKAADSFKRVITLAKDGNLEQVMQQEYPGYYLRYKSILELQLKFDISELSGSCGIWINGTPRCGKDYAARTFDSLYVKSVNKWWDGYKNEKCVNQ